MNPAASPLLADHYLLNMIQANRAHEETETAVLKFFVRKLPPQRVHRMAARLEQVLDVLKNLGFSAEEVDWLARSGRFGKHLLDHLVAHRAPISTTWSGYPSLCDGWSPAPPPRWRSRTP